VWREVAPAVDRGDRTSSPAAELKRAPTMRVKPTQAERFDALFREHYATVRGYARRRANAEQALDAVAETFLIAWRRIDDVPDDALPWLLGVTRKVMANQRRADGRGDALAQRLADAAVGVAADDPADVVGEAELMRDAFERLSDRDREVLLAAAWDTPLNMRHEASRGALAVRLHRARGRLKAQVESLGAVPILILALAIAAALLVTPPGRAGLSWAIELIGIGDVGGTPTQANRAPLRPTTGPLVVDNGRGPDGERYEWVAHRGGLPAITAQMADPRTGEPIPNAIRSIPRATGLCLSLDRPARRVSQAWGGCYPRPERYPPAPIQSTGPIQSFDWSPVRRGPQRGRPGAVMLVGTTSDAVHRLEIAYAAGSGQRDLNADFARVDGHLLRRLGMPRGKPRPFGVFVAFVPARLVARDGLMSHYSGGALLVDRELRTGDRATDACMRRHGRPSVAPYSLTAYSEDGHVVEHRRTLNGDELPRECYDGWFYRELP